MPWNAIMQNSSDFFDPDQVPEGFTLMDPSKMKDTQINEILKYWHDRQETRKDGIGFLFQLTIKMPTKKHDRDDSEPPSPTPEPGILQKQTRSQSKVSGKQKAQSPEKWTKYIQPDSRRRQKHRKLASGGSESESGKSFDFTEVNRMTLRVYLLLVIPVTWYQSHRLQHHQRLKTHLDPRVNKGHLDSSERRRTLQPLLPSQRRNQESVL
jgi:hypothetical protein